VKIYSASDECGVLHGSAAETIKELFMKVSKGLSLLFGAALLVSSSAIAGETNKSSVRLDDKVVVEGKSLDTGKYTVEWSGSGPTVQVTILRGKQTVATFSARLTEQANVNLQDAYSTTAEPDGSRALTAIYPGGKHFALQLDQNQTSQQSNAQPSK
jgi:hypothetical protein